jgi:coenzyme F420-reducing hydrogenase delta subunit|tara:strand:+ start:305 stop:478 length:174 start_codon:yes stop_codon:yes gene_type:complete
MDEELKDRMEHMNFLLKEIRILEKRIKPTDTGYIHTTINTLEQRVKEIQEEILNEER